MILKKLLTALLTASILWAAPAVQAETLLWPYLAFPPLFYEKDGQVQGIAADIQNMLWAHLPEYDHQRVLMPVERMLESLSAGQNMLLVGMAYTPARAEYAVYSVPCRLEMPQVIVFRIEDRDKFGGGGPVSLDALLNRTDLRFGFTQGVSLGVDLDPIMEKFIGAPNIVTVYSAATTEQRIEMILNGRADYSVFDVFESAWIIRELGIEDQIGMAAVEESRNYNFGYVVAPRTQWGRDMIRRIDPILKELIGTEEFYDLYRKYLPANLEPEYRAAWDRLMSEPSPAGP